MRRNYLIVLLITSIIAGCTGRAAPLGTGENGTYDGGSWPKDWGAMPEGLRWDSGAFPSILWKTLNPGTFMMGSPGGEACRNTNEALHGVSLTRPFQLSVTEITQAHYLKVNKENPSRFKGCGLHCPVDSVGWSDAVVFANNLSKLSGFERCYVCVGQGDNYTKPYDCKVRAPYDGSSKTYKTIYDCTGYRLPTEAEWEYAYRAGTQTALYNGGISSCHMDGKVGSIGWYNGNAGTGTRVVKQKKPNAWGLHDMAGNVWEWVNDWYDPSPSAALDPHGPSFGAAKVIRGGAWKTSAGSARGAQRNQSARIKAFDFVGFRIARSGS
jgi:formylglycine-generating enzyme required for sulfatase activity